MKVLVRKRDYNLRRHYLGSLSFSLFAVIICLTSGTLDIAHYRTIAADSPLPIQAQVFHSPKVLATEQFLPDTSPLPMPVPGGDLPVLLKVNTQQPVVFLTIDDGWIKSPEALEWLKQHQLPFTMFLTDGGISDNYNYFKQLQKAGLSVQNHSLHHDRFTKMTLEQQQVDICTTADTFQGVFGKRPTLFRPPYGAFNADTKHASVACGMKAVVLWHAYIENTVLYYQEGAALQPGDIVLAHFQPRLLADIQAFVAQTEKQGMIIGNLEDWL